MRVLAAIVEITALAVLHSRQNLAFGRPVALELVRDYHPGHVLQPLEPLAEKLLGGFLVPPALHQDIEYIVVLIHRGLLDGAMETLENIDS